MTAKPLPKRIYNKAKELGINKIDIALSGGGDEGFCEVKLQFPIGDTKTRKKEKLNARTQLSEEISDWASEAYMLDESVPDDHGIDLTYDLVNMQATYQYWSTQPVYDDPETSPLTSE